MKMDPRLFDEGALERERQQKLEFQRKKYAAWTSGFLEATDVITREWATYTENGVLRCSKCHTAIDRDSLDGIRFHLYQMHRREIGVEEVGISGENEALGSGSVSLHASSDNSSGDRPKNQEGDSPGH